MLGAPVSRVGTVAAIAALIGVAAALAVGGGAGFSPGALRGGDSTPVRLGGVVSHAELGRSCGACHAVLGSRRPMATRCVECHRDIRLALTDTTTLHGKLPDAASCRTCHTEHRGTAGQLTNVEGLGDAHGQFGFALDRHQRTAANQPFACRDCHRPGSFAFEADGCEACHRDYQGPFVTKHATDWGTACQSCHDGHDRFTGGRFVHDSTGFILDGAHQRTTCVACHSNVRALAGYARAPADCVGCHSADDKHRGEFGGDCGSCHTTATWEGARFAHDVFPLDHGEGGRIACKTCHENTKDYKTYTCYNCHEHSRARVAAQHRDEVNTRDLDNCIRCHPGGRGEGEEQEGRRERR